MADLLDHDPVLGVSGRLLGARNRTCWRPSPSRCSRSSSAASRLACAAARVDRPRSHVLLSAAVRRSRVSSRRSPSAPSPAGSRWRPPLPLRAARPASPGLGRSRCVVGALAVALCTLLAASFVALRLRRGRARTRRALSPPGPSVRCRLRSCSPDWSLAIAATAPPAVWHRLIGPALPLVLVGGLRQRPLTARAGAAAVSARPRRGAAHRRRRCSGAGS